MVFHNYTGNYDLFSIAERTTHSETYICRGPVAYDMDKMWNETVIENVDVDDCKHHCL